jgi:hypothetical protein
VVRTLKLTDLLPDAGRPVAYYPRLRRLTGSTNATLLLCQLVYWHGKQADQEGWIFKRVQTVAADPAAERNPENQSLQYETGLAYKELISARQDLVRRGLVRERYARSEHRLYIRLELSAIQAGLGHLPREHLPKRRMALDETEDGILQKGGSLIGTYIDYTQTTTQKKTPAPEHASEFLQEARQPLEIPVTPAAAMVHPVIQLFQQVCGSLPGSSQYQTVIEMMRHFRSLHGPKTVEHLRTFWLAWSSRRRLSDGRPYDPASLTWLTEWALNGSIPPQKGQSHGTHQPTDEKEQALGPSDLSAARRINCRLRKEGLPTLRRSRLPSERRTIRRS